MRKITASLFVILSFTVLGGCSNNPDNRSEDAFKATPSQEAARIRMHKTTKEKRSNYQQ
jgi:hypothetical protein